MIKRLYILVVFLFCLSACFAFTGANSPCEHHQEHHHFSIKHEIHHMGEQKESDLVIVQGRLVRFKQPFWGSDFIILRHKDWKCKILVPDGLDVDVNNVDFGDLVRVYCHRRDCWISDNNDHKLIIDLTHYQDFITQMYQTPNHIAHDTCALMDVTSVHNYQNRY